MINFDVGPEWWSTRVFLVAALAREFTAVEQIVFLENCVGPDPCFLCSATPAGVCAGLLLLAPFLADAYASQPPRMDLSQVGFAFVNWFEQKAQSDPALAEKTPQFRMTKEGCESVLAAISQAAMSTGARARCRAGSSCR